MHAWSGPEPDGRIHLLAIGILNRFGGDPKRTFCSNIGSDAQQDTVLVQVIWSVFGKHLCVRISPGPRWFCV